MEVDKRIKEWNQVQSFVNWDHFKMVLEHQDFDTTNNASETINAKLNKEINSGKKNLSLALKTICTFKSTIMQDKNEFLATRHP